MKWYAMKRNGMKCATIRTHESSGKGVCRMHEDATEIEENLILAAPELLKALENLLKSFEAATAEYGGEMATGAIAARAAIKKAKEGVVGF